MKNITTVGVDLSKRYMHTVFMTGNGTVVKRKMYRTDELQEMIKDLPPKATICAEACGGSHYFGRQLKEHNFDVKLIPPQYVKPYVQRNKNDYNDAIAIGEASTRKKMKFVPIKSECIQGIQALHATRSQMVSTRTQYMNCIRGILLESGVRISQGVSSFNRYIRERYKDDDRIHPYTRDAIDSMLNMLLSMTSQIDKLEKEIKKISKENATTQRLATIPGIGEITSTALITVSGNPSVYKNGRAFSASLGLTPRQNSTANKPNLLGISKQGNIYVRSLLVICAKTLIIKAKKTVVSKITQKSEYKSNDRISLWIRKLLAKNIHCNKVCVAVANKLARISYRILVSGSATFDANLSNGCSYLM